MLGFYKLHTLNFSYMLSVKTEEFIEKRTLFTSVCAGLDWCNFFHCDQ